MLLGIFLIAMIYSGLADRNTTVYTHADFLKWLENDEVQTVVVTPNEEVPTGHVKVALKNGVDSIEHGAKPDAETGTVDWWLRTPGEMQGSQVYVGRDGRVQIRGESAMNHGNGVRPAVWIRID